MTTVLVVDDEAALLRTLSMNLGARGYRVITAENGETALATLRRDQRGLVILDLGLPGIFGAEALRQLRTWSAVPVIVLSARYGSDDKVEALDLGADDYVTKPFGIDELLARLRAAARRTRPGDSPVIQTHGVRIDVQARCAWRDDTEVKLATAAPRSLGTALQAGDQLPPRPHGRPAPQARSRPSPTPSSHHRTRHGIPLHDLGTPRSDVAHAREPAPPLMGTLPHLGLLPGAVHCGRSPEAVAWSASRYASSGGVLG